MIVCGTILHRTAGLVSVPHQLALYFLLVFDGLLVVPAPLIVDFPFILIVAKGASFYEIIVFDV